MGTFTRIAAAALSILETEASAQEQVFRNLDVA